MPHVFFWQVASCSWYKTLQLWKRPEPRPVNPNSSSRGGQEVLFLKVKGKFKVFFAENGMIDFCLRFSV